MIKEEIATAIKLQKAFSIIFDGITDSSKKEACSIILRYVELNDDCDPEVQERLFDIFTTGGTSSANLEKLIVESVQNGSLVFDWLTSQSYDGASNMRGAIDELQARIRKRAPKAL